MFRLPPELSALAAALPKMAGFCETQQAPRFDVVVDHDYDEDQTEIRIFANGELLYSSRTQMPETDDTEPAVTFHLLDSGPWDDHQDHDWYANALERVSGSPGPVRDYVAKRARDYHGPDKHCYPCQHRHPAAPTTD